MEKNVNITLFLFSKEWKNIEKIYFRLFLTTKNFYCRLQLKLLEHTIITKRLAINQQINIKSKDNNLD